MLHPVIRPSPSSTSLAFALDILLLDRKVQRATEHTVLFYQRQLSRFNKWCASHGVDAIGSVTPSHIRAYLVELQERNLADRSIHAAARALRAWLNFCVSEELLDVSPMKKVAMPRMDKKVLPAFTTAEVARLLRACATSRDKAIVLFLLDTGCRASKFIALNGGDLDAKNGTVRIRQGKGRKDRVTYLGNRSRRALLRYFLDRGSQPEDNEPVWIGERNRSRLTDSGLRQLLERLGIRAGVEQCHPHTFRRTFALWSLRAGMSVYHLQRLMGHEDLAMLRQYLALVDEDLQAAHAKFGAVDVGLR